MKLHYYKLVYHKYIVFRKKYPISSINSLHFFNRTKSLLSFGHIFSSSSRLYLLKSSLLFIPILNASIHRKSSNLTPCSRSFSSSTLRSFMPYSSQIWYNSCSVACPILRNFIKYSFGYSLTPSNDSNPFLLRTFRNLLDISISS